MPVFCQLYTVSQKK